MDKKSRDYGDENNRNLRLVIGLSRSNLKMERSVNDVISQYNITLPQFGVMEALYHLGDMKICEIIEKTLSTSGNMTVVIKNLEKESYVLRRQSSDDRRAALISLTGKGQNLIEAIFPVHLECLNNQMKNLNFSEKDLLIGLLKKMNRIE